MSEQDTTEGYEARLARIEAALALTPRSRCDDWDSDTVEWLLAQLRERDRQLAEARGALADLVDQVMQHSAGFVPDLNLDIGMLFDLRRADALLGRQARDEAKEAS